MREGIYSSSDGEGEFEGFVSLRWSEIELNWQIETASACGTFIRISQSRGVKHGGTVALLALKLGSDGHNDGKA